MTFITTVAPNGTISGPLPNAQPLALAQATGAAGATPTAQLLLPNAVVANTVVPPYTEPPRTSKPTLRNLTGTSSSPITAQYLGQTAEANGQELTIFDRQDPPPQQQSTSSNDAFTAPAAEPVPEEAPQPAYILSATLQPGASPSNALAQSMVTVTHPQNNEIVALPKPWESRALIAPQSAANKKPSLASSRGMSAYQLTESRNNQANHSIERVEAVS